MKFKTRLRITLITIIVLPLVLTALAFCMIGVFLLNNQQGHTLQDVDYTLILEAFQTFAETADETYDEIVAQAGEDITKLEDQAYLKALNKSIAGKSAYILVRKDDTIYYAGNPDAAKRIEDKLPAFGEKPASTESGYYYNELNKYVKQFDFYFTDGAQGSIFVVAKISSLISKPLLIDMFIAILFILIFTGVMLTQWMQKSVFKPVDELNVAMQKIKDGNFDYMLQTDVQGEIGDLYRNYEDMRLRLKESTEENQQHEKKNKELVSNITI